MRTNEHVCQPLISFNSISDVMPYLGLQDEAYGHEYSHCQFGKQQSNTTN